MQYMLVLVYNTQNTNVQRITSSIQRVFFLNCTIGQPSAFLSQFGIFERLLAIKREFYK